MYVGSLKINKLCITSTVQWRLNYFSEVFKTCISKHGNLCSRSKWWFNLLIVQRYATPSTSIRFLFMWLYIDVSSVVIGTSYQVARALFWLDAKVLLNYGPTPALRLTLKSSQNKHSQDPTIENGQNKLCHSSAAICYFRKQSTLCLTAINMRKKNTFHRFHTSGTHVRDRV